ncbi:hypothetical protein [Streptomyces chattanoogensis]|uniref:hypothetical protein n=1 Tax=Streptomyces chattanoogensis TaxID=66876 RepID=UPI00367CA93E
MAKLEIGTVQVELTHDELELLRRALRLAANYGEVRHEDATRRLLADLESQ